MGLVLVQLFTGVHAKTRVGPRLLVGFWALLPLDFPIYAAGNVAVLPLLGCQLIKLPDLRRRGCGLRLTSMQPALWIAT